MLPRDAEAAYDALCDQGGLTRRQLTIWAGDRMAAGRPVFVEAGMMRLHGPLDAERFQRAFRKVVDECDALRLAFDDDVGAPRLRVRSSAVGHVELLEAPSPDGLAAIADERVARVGVEGSLYESALVRVAANEHAWLLAQHQLIADAWSFGVVFERTALHYGRLAGAGPVADDPPPSFLEYVERERKYRASARCAAARQRWSSRFAGASSPGESRSGIGQVATTRTRRVERPLGRQLSAAVRALAASEAATADVGLFAVVGAAVAIGVGRNTGSPVVVLNVPFANRPSGRFKRTAGSFMNVWPVRLAVEPGDTFRGVVARAVAEVWETAAHQEYVGRPGPVPHPYEVFLNVHKQAIAARTFADLPMEVRWLAPRHRFGGLAVAVEDFGATRELTLVLDANAETFGSVEREVLADEMLTLLAAAVADPDRHVVRLADTGASSAARASATESSGGDSAARLGRLWCELLAVETVEVEDDFFVLGGDSLLAYRMLVRARAELGIDATVERFLARPTIAGLVDGGATQRKGDGVDDARELELQAAPIVPAPRASGVNGFPASLAQERLWVLERAMGPGTLANVAGAFRAVGSLDPSALRRAFERVAARHEALRTTFASSDGVLSQIVSPHAAVGVRVIDVDSAGTSADRRAAAQRLVTSELERPFDVFRGPLVRVVVARVDDADHVVGIALHHLVADAGSMPILVRELVAAFRDEALPPPTLQYADFAVWSRRAGVLARPRRERVVYWRRRLAELPARTEGGAGDPNPGCRLADRRISDDVVAALRTLARRHGTTLFATMLAAWQAVLARVVGTNDVVVLTPVDERDRPELAEVIGFFVDVVPVRVRWNGDPSFGELLSETATATREAFRWKLPFQTLVEAVGCERGLRRAPLTPFAFALERVGIDRVELPGLELTALTLDRATSRAELAMIVSEGADGTTVRLEYDAGVWDSAAVRRLLEAVVVCLGRVAASPDRPLSEVTRPVDRSATLGVDDAAAGVWERFAAQTFRTPDAVAWSAWRSVATYAELLARAEQVSAALRDRGVAEGEIVAVWGERGFELAASILGILRTNAVYLPLDPRWPEARVAQVLRASGARVVLSDDAAVSALAPLRGDRDGCDPLFVAADARRDARPAAGAAASDAAYVLYTSGSTGTPKGALIEHGGLRNHLRAKLALLGLGASDRVAQTAAAGFDISLWQFLAPWLVGGRTVVFDDATVRDPERLRAAVADEGVTVLELVPAVAQLVLDADVAAGEPALGCLRWLVVTGEALPPTFCREWLARYPRVPIVNAYGPTECADDVAHHVVRTPPPPDAERIPIGTPIDGVALHVLDDALRPVPPGEVGELCVGGIAVGRGYLHDPARSATAFVSPDPTTGEPGTRLYRTGDAGRLRADGTFECLGRRDRQVKIRGVRIELDEIEVVLGRHPSVRQVAVVVRPAVGGGGKLVACVATSAPSVGLAERLRRHVAERLPDAMVPAAFEFFAALPLGPNGKIDRRALARPATARRSVSLVDAPESSCQRVLADAWRDVLGADVRSLDDDFFALGGDSLSSIRVVAALRRAGFLVTPQQIFEHRTIEGIAAVAVPGGADDAEQGLVVGPVPATPVQRAFFASGLDGLDHYNLSLLLEVDERVRESELATAVEHLVRQHDMLRVRWTRVGDRWSQAIATLDGAIPCRHIDLAHLDEEEVGPTIERLADAEQGTLRLATGPVLRVVWFDLGPERPARLLLVVHHLACDVVSLPILVEDLAALVGQLRRGEPIALPAKTTSYQTWAARVALWAGSPARDDEAAFWIDACRDGGARLPVRAAASEYAAVAAVERWRTTLEEDATEAILAAAAAGGTTVEALLLTGLALAVTDGTGEAVLVLWLERHGREPVIPGCDVSRTVGWFTAIFPVRLPIAPTRQPEASLALVHRHLCAIPAGGLGYGALRFPGEGPDASTAAETLRAQPHPEISFNYLGRLDPPTGAGWRLARESAGREVGVRGPRPTVLDVTAHVRGGRLTVEWSYDRARHDEALVAGLATRMLDAVRALARPVDAGVPAGAVVGARSGR